MADPLVFIAGTVMASVAPAAAALTIETKTQATAVNLKLETLNGAVIRLQTIIE